MHIAPTIVIASLLAWMFWQVRSTVAKQRERWKTWNERPRITDDEFFARCGIAKDSSDVKIALAFREALTVASGAPRETLRADDLIEDHFFDSMDWLDVIFRIEKAALVKIPKSMWDMASAKASEDKSKVMIRHLVIACSGAAMPLTLRSAVPRFARSIGNG